MTLQSTAPEAVMDKILQAALEVFAEQGFRHATVREICSRAEVNVASVSYYFRSKEALYVQTLGFAFAEANRFYPLPDSVAAEISPSQKLATFIENLLQKMLDDSQLGCCNKLILREIYEPSQALDEVLQSCIVPQLATLEAILRELLGPEHSVITLQRCLWSVLGQCLPFIHSRSVIERLYPDLIANPAAIQATAQHITQFSLQALAAIKPFSTGLSYE